jgi:hypothetical protein
MLLGAAALGIALPGLMPMPGGSAHTGMVSKNANCR